MDPKFSPSLKLSEIPLVSLREISDTFTLNNENLGSTSDISAKFQSSTLVSVGSPLPKSNPNHAYQTSRSNPILKKSDTTLRSKITLAGPNTILMFKYQAQGQIS